MISENRDPAFWVRIASHPDVKDTLFGLDPEELIPLVENPSILPLASTNGGFFFSEVGSLSGVRELHTLFTPKGWGREVHTAGKQALEYVFNLCDVVTTFEVIANRKSRPPISYGFKAAGPVRDSEFGPVRTWILTKQAWVHSPARRRM